MHRKAMWVMMCRNMGRIVSWGVGERGDDTPLESGARAAMTNERKRGEPSSRYDVDLEGSKASNNLLWRQSSEPSQDHSGSGAAQAAKELRTCAFNVEMYPGPCIALEPRTVIVLIACAARAGFM
jgi:hypothetical protein